MVLGIGPIGTGDARSAELEEAKKDFRQGASKWTSGDGKVFVPAGMTIDTLEPGFYDIAVAQDGGTYFLKMDIRAEELLIMPDTAVDEVVREIEDFWSKKDNFARAKLCHKRGILLYGEPGGGKSCSIRLALQDVIKRGGIGINFSGPDTFLTCVRIFRNIQETTPIVVVMEDLDALVERFGDSRILNILDGVETVNHIVFLASTNFPQKLGERFTNRPSRFDKRFEFTKPSARARRVYLEHIAKGFEIDLEKYVVAAEGMSFAHIRELFVATVLLGNPYDVAVKTIRGMKKFISSDAPKGGELGFKGIGIDNDE